MTSILVPVNWPTSKLWGSRWNYVDIAFQSWDNTKGVIFPGEATFSTAPCLSLITGGCRKTLIHTFLNIICQKCDGRHWNLAHLCLRWTIIPEVDLFHNFSISRWNATLGSESNHAIESAVSENMGNDTKINSLSLILPELPGGHPPVAERNKISLPGRVLTGFGVSRHSSWVPAVWPIWLKYPLPQERVISENSKSVCFGRLQSLRGLSTLLCGSSRFRGEQLAARSAYAKLD